MAGGRGFPPPMAWPLAELLEVRPPGAPPHRGPTLRPLMIACQDDAQILVPSRRLCRTVPASRSGGGPLVTGSAVGLAAPGGTGQRRSAEALGPGRPGRHRRGPA